MKGKRICAYVVQKRHKSALHYSKIVTEVFEIRSESDYDDYYVISKEDVEEQIKNAQFFFDGIMKYVSEVTLLRE